MPKLGDPSFSRTLPQAMFERLQQSLKQMKSILGDEAVLLPEDVLSLEATTPEPDTPQFTLVASKRFSALLIGEPSQPELRLYQVGLTFEPEAIASFLTHLTSHWSNHTGVLSLLHQAQTLLQINNPAIQTEFTLSLLEIFSSNGASDFRYSPITVCKPFVEEALNQQVEQERLLNQVTTQIRQSLELPVILETAVNQVRNFLEVDRLLIYKFDEFNYASAVIEEDVALETNITELSHILPTSQTSFPNSTIRWGHVTYEAKSSNTIPSVLNLVEEKNCLTHVPNCREKYRQGLTFSVDDIEVRYANYSCLLELLRHSQVRSKLIAPIIVQNKLWGLLIAHQCFEPRYWQESEKDFLKQIAEHLAVAIYQAQLYAQLQQQKTTLEQRVIERTQELRDILQAAQAASRAKSDFLAAMSHELRTPLTCVIGMSATLLRWSFGQNGSQLFPVHKQRRYLQTIQESGEHLLELINDILDLSQVEAGKAVLNISEFSLSKLTHQTIRTFQEKANLRQVDLEMDLRVQPLEDRFCADLRRVKQILFNLLGNAVKFTPSDGKVTLRVWREHNLAVFQIEDTGIGIDKEEIPQLFQKFQQLETGYQRNYEGTGLGLALTKQLVELHGGRIEVESVVSEGSLFTVWLPSQLLNSANSTRVTTNHKQNLPPQGSIVLVEDREENATVICDILTAAGYHVIWLIDGSTACGQIELLQPKAAIIDWQLRGMDGYEIIHYLRNSPSTQNLKVLALTTSSLTQEQEEQMRISVDHYLSQPIEPIELLKKITALMGN